MSVAEIMKNMVAYSQRNLHDIDHFLKVWAYAKAIGELEGLGPEEQTVLEVAAITHDIACPLCREKYGNTGGKNQEREGAVLAREFLQDSGLRESQIDRVVYLVGHHHTYTAIEGLDYQILVEADYLVNAGESGYSEEQRRTFAKNVFQTETGRALLQAVFN